MRFYYYWVAVLVLVLDFVTKKLIETKLEIGDQISIIGNFFSSLRIEIAVLHLASCKSKDCFLSLLPLSLFWVSFGTYRHRENQLSLGC